MLINGIIKKSVKGESDSLMIKIKKLPSSLKRIIFITVVLAFFFGAGVMAGNLKPINNVKIAFPNNHEINVLTTKDTVQEILEENHIEILGDEIVVPSLETEITENTTITISKKSETNAIVALASKGEDISLEQLLSSYSLITEKIVVEQIEIPFETITKDISNGNSNTTEEIVQAGKNGLKEVTYKIKYQNDIERQEISSKIIKNPVNKVVNVKGKATVTSRSSASRTTYTAPTGNLASLVEGITPKITTLNASAYCACYKCCGKTNGITASGKKASAWYTVAAGKAYPMGTIIYIPALSGKANGGWFVVQDRGGAISNNKLDIFVGSHSEALQFGRRNLECYIYMV